jgi:hypothetical protein
LPLLLRSDDLKRAVGISESETYRPLGYPTTKGGDYVSEYSISVVFDAGNDVTADAVRKIIEAIAPFIVDNVTVTLFYDGEVIE